MNKNLSALKNKLASISCVVAIFLIVSGMVFIMPVIADLVSTEEKDAYANAMTGEMIFDDYYVSHHGLNNSVIAISVFGQNGEQLSIDPTEYSKTLLLDLMHLEKGDPLQYVLDTETGFLLELTSSDTVIYQKNFGSVLAVFMGVVGAFVLAMGIFSLVLACVRSKASRPKLKMPRIPMRIQKKRVRLAQRMRFFTALAQYPKNPAGCLLLAKMAMHSMIPFLLQT